MAKHFQSRKRAKHKNIWKCNSFWGLGGCDFPLKCTHGNFWLSNNYLRARMFNPESHGGVLTESNSSCAQISGLGQGLDCAEIGTKVTAWLGLHWSGVVNSRLPTISEVTRGPVPAPQSQISRNRESIPDLFSFDFDITHWQPVFLIRKSNGAHKNCRSGNKCHLIHRLIFEISKLNWMCHNRVKSD